MKRDLISLQDVTADEIHYLLGNSCDLDCDFCFWDMRLPDISFKQKRQIIDEIKSTGIRKLTISGGEPTCNRHYLKVLKYCEESGLQVILHTHGLKINKAIARAKSPIMLYNVR